MDHLQLLIDYSCSIFNGQKERRRERERGGGGRE